MNKRREPMSQRAEKKNNKQVHKAMHLEDTKLSSKMMKTIHEKVEKKVSAHQHKQAKRTSPSEKIEGSTPAHVHTENEHWVRSIRSQNLLQAARLKKKLAKKPVCHRARRA